MFKGIITLFGASMMQINTGFFSPDKGVYSAWGYMRDITDIALIIVVLLIIISQLTGYGIDNYGIKKMLPRLIVAILAINLSFLICQVSVDVSNIAGHGLNGFFTQVADDVGESTGLNGVNVSEFVNSIFKLKDEASINMDTASKLEQMLWSAAVIGIMAGSIFPLFILSLIMALVALIAVVVFFVLLSLRDILVVVCITVAPLAFLCNIFPGTETYFKKWLKLFETMLFIYPICGALNGLAKLIKNIFLSLGDVNFIFVIIALIICFVPLLLAPFIILRALNAFGNIGTKISNLTRKGARKVGNSGIMQDARERRQLRQANFKSKYGLTAGSRSRANQRALELEAKKRQRSNFANPEFVNRAREQANLRQENLDAEMIADSVESKGMSNKDLISAHQAAIASGNVSEIKGYGQALLKRSQHEAYAQNMMAASARGPISDNAIKAYSQTAMKFSSKADNPFLAEYAKNNANGRNTEGQKGSMASYFQTNGDGYKATLGKMSASTFANMDKDTRKRVAGQIAQSYQNGVGGYDEFAASLQKQVNAHNQGLISLSQEQLNDFQTVIGAVPVNTSSPVAPSAPEELNVPHVESTSKQETPHFETFDNAAAAEAALKAEIQKQRLNEKNRGGGPKIIL